MKPPLTRQHPRRTILLLGLLLAIALTREKAVAQSSAVLMAPTTKVLSPHTTQFLASISPDRSKLIFAKSTAELAALRPGHVLVMGISPNSPYGFIGRVTSIGPSGPNLIVVRAAPASLTDAIISGCAGPISLVGLAEHVPIDQVLYQTHGTEIALDE